MTSCLASRRLKRATKPLGLLSALILSISFATTAEAAVKVTSVTGASNTENIGTGAADTATPVIFGGITGTSASEVPTLNGVACTGAGLCNSCGTSPINTTPATASCNEEAITPQTEITIQFTSAKAGYPILTDENKTTVIAEGTSSVSIGQTAEIVTTWSAICPKLDSVDVTCDPAAVGELGSGTLYIGVSKDADDSLDDTDDESTQLTVTVSDSMGQAGYNLAPACGVPTAISSICSYAIQSGDEKAVLTDLGKVNNFPTMSGINISAMRVYFQECTWSGGIAASEFNIIHPQSNPVTLGIEVDSNGVPELTENEITGLSNGKTYCTKVGQVDQAMNVGLYTAAADDATASACTADGRPTNYLKDPNTGTDFIGSCHVARPDEVSGVMAESCFIATAAYGSPWAIKVQTFRDFRNKFLLSNIVGRKVVKWYYKTSPKFAKKIARSNTARAITRGALSPIWLFARISLKIGLLATTLLTFAIVAAPFAWLVSRRQRKVA